MQTYQKAESCADDGLNCEKVLGNTAQTSTFGYLVGAFLENPPQILRYTSKKDGMNSGHSKKMFRSHTIIHMVLKTGLEPVHSFE